jgi:uncharacterized protein (TIGR02246 family)
MVAIEYTPEGHVVRRVLGTVLLAAVAAAPVAAQTSGDSEAVRALPRRFCDAWAKHDAHQLAAIMADDIDFVTVGATWTHGRPDFEKYHSRLLTGRFKESSNTPLEIAERFLRPDLAVIHWTWSISGDKNYGGTPRPQRYGMMVMVAEKRNGNWLVVVAQNTNRVEATPPPELEGISTPIPVPGLNRKP